MTAERMTELGFENLPKTTIDETSDAIHEQIDNDPEIADAVFDELHDWHAPNSVCKDNYDIVLEWWVENRAEALHLTQY